MSRVTRRGGPRSAPAIIIVVFFTAFFALCRPDRYGKEGLRAQQPPPPRAGMPHEEVVIVAGGDVLLDRGVRSAPGFRGDGRGLFEAIGPLLKKADLAFANLECPLTTRCYCLPKQYCLHGDIEKASGLKAAGFSLMTCANNHIYDCGRDAIMETVRALNSSGIMAVGAGASFGEAMKPAVMEIKGLRVAVLAFTTFPLEGLSWEPNAPTPAASYRDEIVAAVKSARKSADILIVAIHWGKEYSAIPSETQSQLAKEIAGAGADVIVGHHPHVLQPCVRIGSTWVAYSLGNLVFDSYRRETKLTALMSVRINMKNRKIRVDFTPLEIKQCRPQKASPSAAEKITRLVDNLPR